jgi:hypothetical protein
MVTPDSLRKIAGEFEISAGRCVAKGWPALADHEMGVADCLNKAAEILETANAGAEKPKA